MSGQAGSALELLYTRVESDYSPRSRSGYQTVYHSPGLAEADVKAIEERVQCFDAAEVGHVRLQFFALDDGRAVVTRSTAIESHREITDRNGRAGAFIAHCLILDPAEFKQRKANPFPILDRFAFVDDPEDLVARYGPGASPKPPALPAVDRAEQPTSRWSNAETKKLLHLARQAGTTVGSGSSVLLTGSPAAIEEALRLVFAYLPSTRDRLPCTFDTHIERCSVRPGRFWAVGASRRQTGAYRLVDAEARTVAGGGPGPPSPAADLYFRWIDDIAAGDGDVLPTQAPTAQALALAFERVEPLAETDLGALDGDACASFLRLHPEVVRARLVEELSAALTPALAKLLGPVAEASLGPRELLVLASRPTSPALADLAGAWLAGDPPRLHDHDWSALGRVAREAERWRLLFETATLARAPREDDRALALDQMDAETFRACLDRLGRPIPIRQFASTRHADDLLAHPGVASAADKEVAGLVETLAALGAGERLGPLAARVAALPERVLRALARRLEGRALAPDLAEALAPRDPKTTDAPSLWSRLFHPRARTELKE